MTKIEIKVNDEEKQKIKNLAKANEISMSEVGRRLIRRAGTDLSTTGLDFLTMLELVLAHQRKMFAYIISKLPDNETNEEEIQRILYNCFESAKREVFG